MKKIITKNHIIKVDIKDGVISSIIMIETMGKFKTNFIFIHLIIFARNICLKSIILSNMKNIKIEKEL
jgi:hypothetical protein